MGQGQADSGPAWQRLIVPRAATVRVVLPDGDATGFVVARDGLVVTACHAVAGKTPVFIEYQAQGPSGLEQHGVEKEAITPASVTRSMRLPAEVLRAAPAWDLALLQVFEAPVGLSSRPGDSGGRRRRAHFPAAVTLADGSAAGPGCPVLVVRPTEAGGAGVVSGRVLEVRTRMDGIVTLVLSAEIEPGDSGAPVLDREGRVLGVIMAMNTSEEGPLRGRAYAVVSNYLFDGADALLRGRGLTVPLDARFLMQQLEALAQWRARRLPVRSVPADQAFVTRSRYLAVVAECPAALRNAQDTPLVDIRIEGGHGEILLDTTARARISFGADPEQQVDAVVYSAFLLTPEEYSGILEAGTSSLEVRYDPCLLVRHLPLIPDGRSTEGRRGATGYVEGRGGG